MACKGIHVMARPIRERHIHGMYVRARHVRKMQIRARYSGKRHKVKPSKDIVFYV
jgi:hypothetical protein